MSEFPKKPDPPKKPEARTAGAATTREDVFNVEELDDLPPSDGSVDPAEEKITFREALKESVVETRRFSMDFFGKKEDENRTHDSNNGASKTA